MPRDASTSSLGLLPSSLVEDTDVFRRARTPCDRIGPFEVDNDVSPEKGVMRGRIHQSMPDGRVHRGRLDSRVSRNASKKRHLARTYRCIACERIATLEAVP